MKYIFAGFLLLFITSCDSANTKPTPEEASEEFTEEAPAEEAMEEVGPSVTEPTGPSEEDWAFIKGIYAAQPRIVQAAGQNNHLFLLSFLRMQKEEALVDQIQEIINKALEFEPYSVEILSYDEENAFIEWKTEDEFETVINQMKLYPYQYEGFEFAVRTSTSNYLGPDQWRSNIYPAYFRNTIEQLEHDQVMTNKGLIAQKLKPEQSVLWGEIAEEVKWKIEADSPFIWAEYEGNSVKMVYDGDGRIVLPNPSLSGMTEKDTSFIQMFKDRFPSYIQEGLSDFARVKSYAAQLNFAQDLKRLEEIEARMGVVHPTNWSFKAGKNYFGAIEADSKGGFGYQAYHHKPSGGDVIVVISKTGCEPTCSFQIDFVFYKQKKRLGKRLPEEYIEKFNSLPKRFKQKFEGRFEDDNFEIQLGYSTIEIQFKKDDTVLLKWNGEQFVEKK